MRYKTKLIDEATFYRIKGLEYKVKRTGSKSGEWSFERTPKLNELMKSFFGGEPRISLTKWLMVRTQLKYETSQLEMPIENSVKGIKGGTKYWYVENGKILQAFYGSSDIHQERIKNDNFFLSKTEAELSIVI